MRTNSQCRIHHFDTKIQMKLQENKGRNVVNDVIAVIETPADDITLDLDSEELL